MKRVQLFEIEDQAWCPPVIRDGVMRALGDALRSDPDATPGAPQRVDGAGPEASSMVTVPDSRSNRSGVPICAVLLDDVADERISTRRLFASTPYRSEAGTELAVVFE